MMTSRLFALALAATLTFGQQKKPQPPPAPAVESTLSGAESTDRAQRVELNLLGQTDADAGESRRNENVQFNLVDNNALKELNVRLGTTATIIREFQPERSYFGAEFGNAPSAVLHAPPVEAKQFHGNVFYGHQNSVFSARSFFQVGSVKAA